MVAPEVAVLALDPALLVPGRRGAELRLERQCERKADEPDRLLAPVAAQNLAHGAGQVVVAQDPVDPAEVGEGVLVRLEEGLLRRAG